MSIRGRSIQRNLLSAATLLLGLLLPWGSQAFAQPTAADYLRPRVERGVFQELCDALNLDPEQRMIFLTLFEDYLLALEETAAQADAQADTVGRQELKAAMEGRTILTADQLRSMRLAVLTSYSQSCLTQSTQLLDELLTELELILLDMQVDRWPQATQRLRRQVYLHPRQAQGHLASYAGDGVDIYQLVETSTELGLDLAQDRALVTICAEYEQRLDEIIIDAVGRQLLLQIQIEMARITGDVERLQELEAIATSGWDKLFVLNQETAALIEQHLEAIGQSQSIPLWQQLVDGANFPWIFAQNDPLFIYEWMAENRPVVAARADQFMDAYKAERGQLQQQMMAMIVEARTKDGIVLHPDMARGGMAPIGGRRAELHAAYLRLTGSQTLVDSKVQSQLLALLEPGDVDIVQRAVRVRG